MHPTEYQENDQATPVTVICPRRECLEGEELLNRKDTSEYCALIGTPVAVATLAKLACIGGGPEMCVLGRRVYYRPSVVRAWRDAKLKRRASTSEAI